MRASTKLVDESGRPLGPEDAERTRVLLSFDLLDGERLVQAERMAIIYTAIHAFENTVRHFVSVAMAEEYKESWWEHVPTKVQKKVATRVEEDSKFRWHGSRGGSDIDYCDFGDLSVDHYHKLERVRRRARRPRVGQVDTQYLGTLAQYRHARRRSCSTRH